MAYEKQTWTAGDAITQERMMHIENGIAAAALQTDVNNKLDKSSVVDNVSTNDGTKALSAKQGYVLDAAINRLTQDVNVISVDSEQGRKAWTQVQPAITMSGDVVTKSLTQRFTDDETAISNINKKIGGNYTETSTVAKDIGSVRDNLGILSGVVNRAAGSFKDLQDRLDNVDETLGSQAQAINGISNKYDNARGTYETIEKRFAATESEISTARGHYANLNARISADELTNTDQASQISDLQSNKVNVSDIKNDLISSDTNKPLSANMGKTLRDLIGGTYTSSSTVTTAINAAETNAKSYTNSLLGEGFNSTDKQVVDVIDNALAAAKSYTNSLLGPSFSSAATVRAAVTALDGRVSDVEDAIDTLNGDASTEGSVLNTIAAVVANAPEAFDTLKEIADWIDDHSADALEMQQNISDNANAIAALQNTVGDENSGLVATANSALAKANAAAVKTEVDSSLSGLDARLDAIDGGEALTGAKTLATRVSEAESAITTLQNEPKSATEVISVENFEALEANEANSHKDYLVGPDSNNLYKYYHIIETSDNVYTKVLISGGSSGSGNTSGMDLTAVAYDDLQEHSENTDYYVAREDGVHHYRWIPGSNNVLEEIEISNFINTNNIKTYNATTSTTGEGDEQETYLDLYEFNYGADNTTIDPENSTLRAHILLPKGGGGGVTNNITARLVRIGNETIQTITNSKVNLYVFFSAWDQDQSYSGDYTLKYNNTVIKTDVFTSGAINATPINWIVVENPQFENDVPVINSPDTSKLYITNVNEVYTQWTYDGSNWSSTSGAPEGFYAIDISDQCKKASINNNVSLSVSYGTGITPLGKTWKVNIYELNIESNAPDTLLINSTDSYSFPYTSFGALNKTLHVVIDNDKAHEITAPLSAATSGYASTISIPPQAHGTHKIEMYLTAMVGGVEKTTASIIREYIWYDVNNEDAPVLIASPLNGQTISASQYSTIEIPYQVYKKDASTIHVYYYLNDNTEPYDHIILNDVNTGVFSYVATNDTDSKITIKVDDESVVVNLDITASPVNVSPVTGAIIDFDPASLTNSSANRLPKWTVGANTYSLTASDNFNWSEDASGGGYKTDIDGKAFVIKAGSYIDLDYPMFAGTSSNNVLTKGAEMKIIFKTEAVRDIEAVWFTNTGTLTGKTVGIQLGAHYGWLKTDKATDTATEADTSEYDKWVSGTLYKVNAVVLYKDTIYKCITEVTEDVAATNPKDATSNWLSMGKIDTEVLATNSYLYFPYSEQDKIELDININKYNTESATNFIMSYEDGVPSKAYAYEFGSAGDGLYHNNTIRIGSPDCDVYIYRLRIYDKALDTDDILQNFIADGQDITEKVKRYNRNCIYWDSTQNRYFTSPSANAHLDPIKLAEVMPDVKVLMLDTPVFTTGKKNFVQNSSLRCIHAEGGNVYKSRGDADNWLFTNGFHSGQGTTSDNYGQSSRNVDFLFEVDGVNYPAKNKNMKGYTPSKDYVSTVYIGNDASIWDGESWTPAREPVTTEICSDWKEDNCKVSLTETSVPNNYFNLKVNVASSENVNNALFQKRYDDFLAYKSPAQTNQIAKHRNAYAALGMNPDKIKVKNSMEFVPAVLFVRENSEDISKHTEFKDRNWHFYALGNIGDSKKTDYTRAYDPDDMNEFTLENSDNNTKNGQFQSGVYMDGNTRVVERNESGSNPMQFIWGLSDEEWNATREPTEEEIAAAAEEEGIDVRLPNGQVYVNYRHRMLYAEPFDGDHSFEFRYACCGDYRDGDLINPLKEDTDPDKVARYKADKAQEKLNTGVFYAFYDWLVMSDDATFKAEASQWIVPAAMEFFYAYTHYYTMMDNRAKNTFWHFAKTGTYVEVTRPVAALLHVYEESDDDGATWHKATGTEIVSAKRYRTQYAFDLWAYDMDTAAGIDNNGAQVFPYGKEDGDYRVEGDSLSGYAFNGAGSIFWRRIKTSFANEIRDVMTQTDEDCFNSQDLIDEFDNFQNCFPEEIWRLDIERKYIRTFTGESIDNSVEAGKQNPRFLTSMMQGRKKYQRRQWIRDQGVYFNSKYRLPDIIANENTLEFNATTPDVPLWVSGSTYAINSYVRVKVEPFNEDKPRYEVYRCIEANSDTNFTASKWHKSVTPSYYLQLTPYQDMYLNVQLGNGNYQNSYMTDGPATLRAKAGQTYTFDLFGSYQETRIYINGTKHLSAISNLGPMYPYKFDLRGLDHLKVLGIGVDEADYRNAKLDALELPNFMPLLETVNVKNCHSLGKTLVLSTANNIRTVEAAGTIISGVSLPDYTSIETLHLPSTVVGVNLYGARFLNDFKVYNNAGEVDYGSLFKLHIYDSDYSTNVDWIDIAAKILEKQSLETEISLLKLNVASIGDIQELEQFKNFKSTLEAAGGIMQLGGTIHVTGSWSDIERTTYEDTWAPNLELDVSGGTEEFKAKVVYKTRGYYNDSGWVPEQEIETRYIGEGEIIPDIYFGTPVANLPSRNPTVSTVYQFGSINQGNYVMYSGWTTNQSGSNPTSLYNNGQGYTSNNPYRAIASVPEVTLYTFFNEAPHYYTVNWYLEEGKRVKQVANQAYGGGYTLEAPTVKEIRALYPNDTAKVTFNQDNTVTITIFDGWEKLPTNISPSLAESRTSEYNIYAKWYTKTISLNESDANSLFADTSNPTLEQLLVRSRMDSTNREAHPKSENIIAKKQFSYTAGFNGSKEGTTIVNTNQIQQFSGQAGVEFSNIQPFKDNSGFTIAIDYQFDASQSVSVDAAVLVGCFAKANGGKVGFALYNNANSNYGSTGATVGYGNMFSSEQSSISVGNLSQRNIIVLRHPANSSELWVYSSKSGAGNSLESTTMAQRILLSSQVLSSDAKLCLGHLRYDISGTSSNSEYAEEKRNTMGAYGTIYWAKYWDEDLGAGECKQLAAWPHESVTMCIASVDTNPTDSNATDINNSRPAIYLTALNGSAHGYIQSTRFNTSAGTVTGWNDFIAKALCDGKVFNSLPIRLQSILASIPVGYYNYTATYNTNTESVQYALSNLDSTPGYVYIPSVSSIDPNNSYTTYQNESLLERNVDITRSPIRDITPYSWLNDSSSMRVYQYSFGSETPWTATNANMEYYNLRFPNKPIKWSTSSPICIYEIARSAVGNTTLRNIIPDLKVGDIVVLTGEAAYMYVSTDDMNAGVPTEPQGSLTSLFNTTLNNNSEGGWVRSNSYITRSVSASTGNYNNFIYVNAIGHIERPDSSNNQPGILTLNYAFTI